MEANNKYNALEAHNVGTLGKVMFKVSALHSGSTTANDFVNNIANIIETARKEYIAQPANQGKLPYDINDTRNVLSEITGIIVNHVAENGSLRHYPSEQIAAAVANSAMRYYYEQNLGNSKEIPIDMNAPHPYVNPPAGVNPPVSAARADELRANIGSPYLPDLVKSWSAEDYTQMGRYTLNGQDNPRSYFIFTPKGEADPLRKVLGTIVYELSHNTGDITVRAGELTSALMVSTPNKVAGLQITQVAGAQSARDGDDGHAIKSVEPLSGLNAMQHIAGPQNRAIFDALQWMRVFNTNHSQAGGDCKSCAITSGCPSSTVSAPVVERESGQQQQQIGA